MRSYLELQHVKNQGFSLIELMIVVAIIGIIAAIALPSYSDYVRRGKATEATSTLANLKIKMEQYYQDNRTYVNTGGLIAPCAPAAGTVKFFAYACTTQSATAFTIVANPLVNAGMTGFQFTINETGARTSNYNGSGLKNCWLTSKTGSCS